MPNVRGKSIDSAINMMQQLGFDVEIDSTFDPTFRPLSIIKQVPDTGSLVKEGRTIFLTVNMRTPPKIALPNIKDLSYKSAEMILKNHKLIVGDTVYRADIATGAVLEASYKGKIIVGGDLDLIDLKIQALPANLSVGGDIWISDVNLKSLPDSLIVNNNLSLLRVAIQILPDNLKVPGNLDLSHCEYLKSLPSNLIVGKDLTLKDCKNIKSLPEDRKSVV
jgi:hypothetical protein